MMNSLETRVLSVRWLWPLMVLLVACQPDSPIEKAELLQAEGRYEEALDALRAGIDAGQRDPELLYTYGLSLSRLGDVSLALWPLREAARDPEWFSLATMEIAGGAFRAGNFDYAIEELGTLIEEDPGNAVALRHRAMARLRTRRDYEGALEDIDDALELEPDGVDMRIPRIVALLGLERNDEAAEALEALAATKQLDEATSGEEGASLEDEEADPEGDSASDAVAASGEPFEILVCAASAKFAEEKGDMEVAGERYEGCLERFPGASLVVRESLDFYESQGNRERMESILKAAYEAAGEDRGIRIAWARTLELQGKMDEAEGVLREAADAKHPGAALDLGAFLAASGSLEEAVIVYQRGVDTGNASHDFMLAYAEVLLRLERYEDSLAAVEQITVPSHAALIRGRIALAQGRSAEALAYFSEGTLLWPDNAVARYYTALAAEQVADFDRAIEEYRYAIRVDSTATDARERIARLHLAEQDPASAMYMVRYQSSDAKEASRSEAALFLEMEALGQARPGTYGLSVDVRRHLEDPANWGRAVAAMARGAWRRGGASAAEEVVRNADRLDLSAEDASPALRVLVESLAVSGAAGKGLALARRAVEQNPQSPQQLEILGQALRYAGEFDEALSRFDDALARVPELRAAHLGSARVHSDLGNAGEARRFLERVAELPASEVTELREEARLWLALGEREKARSRLRDAIVLNPYDGAAAALLITILEAEGAEDDVTEELRERVARFSAESGAG